MTSPTPPTRKRNPRRPRSPTGLPSLPGFVRVPTHTGSWYAILGRDGRDGSLVRVNPDSLDHVCSLPEVTQQARYRDPAGEITALRYALRWADGTTATVDDSTMHRPETWTGQPLKVKEPKLLAIIATAIGTAAETLPLIEGTPAYDTDRLRLAPPPWGPAGLAATSHDHDENSAMRLMRNDMTTLAAANPKVALVMGAALGGLYIEPLRREPFVLHMVGDSSEGKSTALTVAAAVLGDPDQIRQTWNQTPVAILRYLGSLAVLPAFYDELGASNFTPKQVEELIFRATEGASRRAATRTGTATTVTGRWRSLIISSGNRGLSNITNNPGLAVRAIDLPSPIIGSAADAEHLEALARAGYGWPLRALIEEQALGGDLDRMRHHLIWAETELDAGRGGIAGRIARHLALCVAGAYRLGWLISGPSTAHQLGQAALQAARDHLATLEAELDDRGNMGDQLADAIVEARLARPYAFPSDYHADHAVRQLEGFDNGDGRLVVYPGALRRIAAEAGIADPNPGLRDLRSRRILRSSGHNLTASVRVGHVFIRAYEFNIQNGPVTPPVTPPQPPQRHAPTPPDQPFFPTVTLVTPVTPPKQASRDTRMTFQDRLGTLTRTFVRLGMESDPRTVGQALQLLEEATGLAYEGPTPARAGLVWLHAVNAHHSIPGLTRQDIWLPERPRVAFPFTDPAQADRNGALVQLDLNSAYANAAQSLELGTGAPVRISSPSRADLKHPGFVTVAAPDPGWPAPFHLIEADRPIYTGAAALLWDWLEQPPELVDAVVWTEHRRWLRPFARRMLVARAALEAQNTPGAARAVLVLKRIYAAALGGMLASTAHNRTAYLRPDWALIIRAHAQTNLWRQLAHASPGPVAVATDSASFIVPAGELPAGLTISAQPGKFKVERTAALSDPIRDAIRAGQPRKVQLLTLRHQIDV